MILVTKSVILATHLVILATRHFGHENTDLRLQRNHSYPPHTVVHDHIAKNSFTKTRQTRSLWKKCAFTVSLEIVAELSGAPKGGLTDFSTRLLDPTTFQHDYSTSLRTIQLRLLWILIWGTQVTLAATVHAVAGQYDYSKRLETQQMKLILNSIEGTHQCLGCDRSCLGSSIRVFNKLWSKHLRPRTRLSSCNLARL